VIAYHQQTLPSPGPGGSLGLAVFQPYLTQLGAWRVAPVLLVGIVLALTLAIWSCCRLSCCGRCCGSCCRCCRRTVDASDARTTALTALALLLVAGGLALLAWGFTADAAQADAVASVSTVIAAMLQWKDDGIAAGDAVVAKVEAFRAVVAAIAADPSADSLSGGMAANLTAATDGVRGTVDGALAQLLQLPLVGLQTTVGAAAETGEQYRRVVVVSAICGLVGLLFLQMLVSLGNAHARPALKPSRVCCGLPRLIGAVFVFAIFLAWTVAAVLLGGTTVLADFCVDVDDNILALAGLAENPVAVYYITCDEAAAGNLSNPLAQELSTAATLADDLLAAIDALVAAVDPVACDAEPDSCALIMTDLPAAAEAVRAAIGVDKDADGNFDTGMLAFASCTSLNGVCVGRA